MALRRSSLAFRTGKAQKVGLVVLATSMVSGVRPCAAIARGRVAELKMQLAKSEQQLMEAEKQAKLRGMEAEKQAKLRMEAEGQAKLRIWGGVTLVLLMALVMCGIITGIVPRMITRKLPPSVVEAIKALHR